MSKSKQITELYKDWFLEYASYVITDRAVPNLEDGLKPVQRRILHALKELDDGRYNKVANIIGHTMKYHPHGDAAIGGAFIQLGQKNYLIDTQGNWGNILTGDNAAAPRYIEARFTKFANDILFSPKITTWIDSYDKRNKEPLFFPVKFPLLLALGTEGIAVGLACKILPHNFNEIIDASINILRKKPFTLLPDFPTGGIMDASNYANGLKGSRVRVRANITSPSKALLCINEIPFGTTTSSIIDSILSANQKEKIKIKKVEDNTSKNVEILIHLHPGTDHEKLKEALYVFTDCEVSISPNACVIYNNKPEFLGIQDILKHNVKDIKERLKQELIIQSEELKNRILFLNLERIFIEEKIYKEIETCTTQESIISTVKAKMQPFVKKYKLTLTDDDANKLVALQIKRISKFDMQANKDLIKTLNSQLEEVTNNITNINRFTISFFKSLSKKYGSLFPRLTKISDEPFENIVASKVARANHTLYVDYKDGFVGYNLKKTSNPVALTECTNLDDILVIRKDGTLVVSKITEKLYMGKDILFAGVYNKDVPIVFSIIYKDKDNTFLKRFTIGGITRNKEYIITGKENRTIIGLYSNSNEKTGKLHIKLKPKPRLKVLNLELPLSKFAVKGRQSMGVSVTKHQTQNIKFTS